MHAPAAEPSTRSTRVHTGARECPFFGAGGPLLKLGAVPRDGGPRTADHETPSLPGAARERRSSNSEAPPTGAEKGAPPRSSFDHDAEPTLLQESRFQGTSSPLIYSRRPAAAASRPPSLRSCGACSPRKLGSARSSDRALAGRARTTPGLGPQINRLLWQAPRSSAPGPSQAPARAAQRFGGAHAKWIPSGAISAPPAAGVPRAGRCYRRTEEGQDGHPGARVDLATKGAGPHELLRKSGPSPLVGEGHMGLVPPARG